VSDDCEHDWRVSPWVVPNAQGGQLCVCATCTRAAVLYLGLTDAVVSWPKAGYPRAA